MQLTHREEVQWYLFLMHCPVVQTDTKHLFRIASEMPVPHSLGKYFNTMRYRSTVSVQTSEYFQSTVSYIKVQTMFK